MAAQAAMLEPGRLAYRLNHRRTSKPQILSVLTTHTERASASHQTRPAAHHKRGKQLCEQF